MGNVMASLIGSGTEKQDGVANEAPATDSTARESAKEAPKEAATTEGEDKAEAVGAEGAAQAQEHTEKGEKADVAELVEAKIADLEKEKEQEEQAAAGGTENSGEIVTSGAADAEADNSRAAVEEALLAGANPPGGGLAVPGGEPMNEGSPAVLGGVAVIPPKHINHRPTPPPNYKAKI